MSDRPAILDITFDEVEPFDVIDEGVVVRTVTRGFRPATLRDLASRLRLGELPEAWIAPPAVRDFAGCPAKIYAVELDVGSLVGVEEPTGLIHPVWSDMKKLHGHPTQPIRVARGVDPPVRRHMSEG